MQFIAKKLSVFVLFSIPLGVIAQSTFLSQGSKHQPLLDRLEIKLQRNADLNLFTAKPIARKRAVLVAEQLGSGSTDSNLLSVVDKANLQSLLMNNSEWVTGSKEQFLSKKPLLGFLYKYKANAVEVHEKDFFLALNPVLQGQFSSESGNNERLFVNTKGVTFRGLIAKKIGFSAYLTDNQERGPRFFEERIDSMNAVPGVGFYKTFKKTAADYFDGRGSIHFSATKYLDMQFGYDKNFIGSGYRSMFLSDHGNSYLFLKVNTRIWKLNYMNLFMELAPQTPGINAGNKLLEKKYAAVHHLSINATPWLNVGLFEAVLFGRKDHFDFTYLNPIMFLRIAEQQNGSADNALVGLDFKANVAKIAQFYGQFLFDEFLLKELRSGKGWWANKFAIQLGAKYIDAFGIDNLDLQGEINTARPFTYSHFDSVSNHSHYNQPLAHPLGANFFETIGMIRYQPHPKWTTSLRLIFWQQGWDSTGTKANYGSDIFKLNQTRSAGDYGYTIGSGIKGKGMNAQWLLSYEWKENLFLEVSALYRKLSKPAGVVVAPDASVITVGVRMNMFRREYDY